MGTFVSLQDREYVVSLNMPQGKSSSQAKGTNSTSFLTCVRNEVELVPLACEDEGQ